MINTFFVSIVALLILPSIAMTAELTRAGESKKELSKDSSAGGEKDSSEDKTLEGHSFHGEAFNEGPRQAAYLMGNTGDVTFPIKSPNRLVQQFVNQGVGQLHGFWYLEAERSFRQAAALDEKCAAAYWGMAMANANNKDRAKKFSKEAVDRRDHATKRVSMYIDALHKKLNAKDKKKGFEQYVKALEKIVYAYPDDIEAKAFIAVAMWQGRNSGSKITSHLAVDALLGEVLAANPMHPCHHYRIHLWDYEKPERALKSSALCGQAASSIAHMWHMPGHIFSRLKRYEDAAWQQEASARTDHAHMMRDQLLPDQIHNFAHNNEWLIRNLMFVGRVSDALDLAKNMTELPRHPKYNLVSKRNSSSSYGRTRLFQVLSQGELWEELIKLADTPYLQPTEEFAEQVKRLRYLGRAHGWLGNMADCKSVRDELQAMHDKLTDEKDKAVKEAEEKASKEYDKKNKKEDSKDESKASKENKDADAKADDDSSGEKPESTDEEPDTKQQDKKTDDKSDDSDAKKQMVDKKRKAAIDKATKKAKSDYDRKLRRIKKAIDELDAHAALAAGDSKEALKLFKDAGDIDKWQLAGFRHRVGETDEAIKDLEKYIDGHKGEALPLAYLADIAWQADKKDKAKRAFEKLRDISSSIDLAASPFARLKPIAVELRYSDDWRKPHVIPEDAGERPGLDDLGPFRWQPHAAPEWMLEDSAGSPVSINDYKGRPVVVIFYLGYGCLHCVEQLQAFTPQAETFRKAGIEMVAISTDKPADLTKSVADFGSTVPIRLLSNSELDVFKTYRAFDDFENQPLHGTFLIDGEGRIRWQDIGHEPFMDHEFVLKESKRLVNIKLPGDDA